MDQGTRRATERTNQACTPEARATSFCRRDNGFSLVEVLVSIVLLGTAGVVILGAGPRCDHSRPAGRLPSRDRRRQRSSDGHQAGGVHVRSIDLLAAEHVMGAVGYFGTEWAVGGTFLPPAPGAAIERVSIISRRDQIGRIDPVSLDCAWICTDFGLGPGAGWTGGLGGRDQPEPWQEFAWAHGQRQCPAACLRRFGSDVR